jgi:hypothetical protein
MTQDVNALLIFCEGPQDISFVRHVMECFLGFERAELKFSDFPSPLNQLFPNSILQHAAKDLSLDMAHKFFLPDRVMVNKDQMALLFNTGGKTQSDKVKLLLTTFLPLLAQAAVFQQNAPSVIRKARYLFLYDADHMGFDEVLNKFIKEFAEIDGSPWLQKEWIIDKVNPFAACAGDQALYIWGETHKCGTLEDILMVLFEQSEPILIQKAINAVDQMFTWDTTSVSIKTSIAEKANRKKAIITVAGQQKKPGMSMNVILDQAKLIRQEVFEVDKHVQSFVAFLSKFFEPLAKP